MSLTKTTLTRPANLLLHHPLYFCNWFGSLGGERQYLGCKSNSHEVNFPLIPMWAPLGSTLRSMEILCRDGEGEKGNVVASICGHRAQLKGNRQNLSALSLLLCSNMNQHARVYSVNFIELFPWSLSLFLFPLYAVCILPSGTKNMRKDRKWHIFLLAPLKCPYHVFTFLSFGEIQNRLQKFPLCVIYLPVQSETRVAPLVLPVTKLQ